MKKTLGTLAALLFAASVPAQNKTIQLQVVDQLNQQPISGASIQWKQETRIASENGTAQLTITGSQNELTVRISAVGYKTVERKWTPPFPNELKIALQPYSLLLAPLEVKAIRASDRAPFTKTNLSKAEIEKNNLGQDLPFLLNQTPSVVVNSDAGNGVGYTGIRIRGSDPTRINMTINGIPYNDAESQGIFFVNLPDLASSVQSIQIQRGVGTSSNGAGAFGATLNLSTNEFNDQAYAEFSGSAGSFNTWKSTVKAGSGLLNNHFTIDARLSQINSDGFIDRGKTDLRSFYLSGAYVADRTSIRFNAFSGAEKTYQAWYGIPESMLRSNRRFNSAGTEKPGEPYENETDNYQQDHYQLFINHRLKRNWSFQAATFFTRGRGYYEQYKANRRFSSIGLPNPVINGVSISRTDIIRQLWLDNWFYGQTFSTEYKDEKNIVTIGGGWNTYMGDHFGTVIWSSVGQVPVGHRWYDLPAIKKDANAYVKWQRKINHSWEAFADLQVRDVDYTMTGFRDNPTLFTQRQFFFVNPKAGISYKKNGHQWYLSYAVGNREPNRDDFEAGATNQPVHETLHNIESGWEKKWSKGQIQANFFYMYYVNQLVLTGKINDVGAYARQNIASSYRMGIELQGSYTFNNWLQVQGNLAISRNKIASFTEFIDNFDTGNQESIEHRDTDIAFSPNVVGGLTFDAQITRGLTASWIQKYVGRQYLDNTQNASRSLNPFWVNDLRINWKIASKWWKDASMTLQVNNLFNYMYEPNGYTFSYITGGARVQENFFFPMAGTNWMLGVQWKL